MKKEKKKINWRTLVWPKYLISLGVVSIAAAATLAIFKYNSANPQLQQGTAAQYLKNEFLDPSATPKMMLVNIAKDKSIAEFDPKRGEEGSVKVGDNWVEYNQFLNDYYKENKALPYLNIRYGSFDFYNEYLEAVTAKDFYEFTQWFMKNVSWGPEIITLKEFSIVKGVEQKGNSITLGAHANQEKEVTTIKFFPDAFFGSLPLHSRLSGSGNAPDSLLYKINKKLLTSDEIKKFLEKTNEYNSLANISKETLNDQSFRSINDKRALLGKKIFAVKGPKLDEVEKNAYSSIEKARLGVHSDYVSIVFANDEKQAKDKFASQLATYAKTPVAKYISDISKYTFEQKTIVNAVIQEYQQTQKQGAHDEYLQLIFDDGKTFVLNEAIDNVEYHNANGNAKADIVEDITQGFEHAKQIYSSLVSNVEALYSKYFTENKLFTEEKRNKLSQLVQELEELGLIEQKIIELNNFIQSHQNTNQGFLESEVSRLDKEIATHQAEINELNTQISAKREHLSKNSLDEQAKNQGYEELIKLQQELKTTEDKLHEALNKKEKIEKELAQIKLKGPLADQLKNAHDEIINLNNKKQKSNPDLIKKEIADLLVSIGLKANQADALVGLEKLHNEIKSSKFQKITEKFDTDTQKAQYTLDLRMFVAQKNPYYVLYNEILGGDPFAKLKPESPHVVLYSVDTAFLPTQLIALDELKDLINHTQVNWRDYSNLDGFLRSQNDIKTKEFYVYAPKINEISKEVKIDEQKLNQMIDQKSSKYDQIVQSFSSDKELSEASQAFDSIVKNSPVSVLFTEFESISKDISYTVDHFIANTKLQLRLDVLNTIYRNDNLKTTYYPKITEAIDSDSLLKTHKDDIENLFKTASKLKLDLIKQNNSFKDEIVQFVKKLYAGLHAINDFYKKHSEDFKKYSDTRFKVFDQKIAQILNEIKSVNLSNEKFSQDLSKILEFSKQKVAELKSSLSSVPQEIIDLNTQFSNSIQYVNSLIDDNLLSYENYFKENFPFYASLILTDVFAEIGFKGEQENQKRKFIGALVNPVYLLKEHISHLNTQKATDLEQKAVKLEELLSKNGISESEIKSIKDQIVDAKAYANYYKNLAKKTLGDDQLVEKLSQINELREAWNQYDFDAKSTYDIDALPEEIFEKYRDKLGGFVGTFNEYMKISTKYNDAFNNIKEKLLTDAQKLYMNAHKIVGLDSTLNTSLQQTKQHALNISRRDIIDNVAYSTLESSKPIELNETNKLVVANSKIELIDKLTKLGIIKERNTDELNEFVAKNVHKVHVKDFKKDNSKLIFTLIDSNNQSKLKDDLIHQQLNQKYLKFSVDAKSVVAKNKETIREVKDFLALLGYKLVLQPSTIKEEGSKVVVDENGQSKTVSTFNIYSEAYDGFTEELLAKVPWAGEYLDEEHLEKSLNEKGEFEYKIVKGKFLGFRPDSRIGLWALIAMANPKYKGLSIDFLKFVAAHEYGHHITLNAAQDLGDKGQKPLFGSALLPGATPSINNYYSRDTIDLYLKARTHLGLNSSPFLNQPNIQSENNEGEYLLFNEAHKKGDKVVIDKSTLEQSKNVWGHEIGKEDLKDVLQNDARRFVQTYEGLLKATEKRRQQNGLSDPKDQKWLEVFDLWLMNTLDQNSGTLNPTKNSDSKNPVKYMIKDKDGKWRFKPATLAMLKGVLKDGKGNDIEFEELNGHIVPKIVEGQKDADGKYIKITKVLVYNANGTPIVNVPLNIDFTSKNNPYLELDGNKNVTVDFIDAKIKEAIRTIVSLIVDEYSINGWDKSTTDTSIQPSTQIAYPKYSEFLSSAEKNYNNSILKPYVGYLKSRDVKTGALNPNFARASYYDSEGNEVDLSKNPLPVPGIPGGLAQRLRYENYYLRIAYAQQKTKADISDLINAFYSKPGQFLTSFGAGGNHSLWLNSNEQYIANIALEESYEDINIFGDDGVQTFDLKKSPKSFGYFIPGILGNNPKTNQYLVLDSHGNIVQSRPSQSQPNGLDYASITQIKINESLLPKDVERSLFESYFIMQNGAKKYGFDISFSDIDSFIRFASVDTTKAQLDPNKKVVNWDLDYVKERFDIEKFVKGLQNALSTPNTLSAKERQRLLELLNLNDQQAFANEIMSRFSTSRLALFMKDISLKTINDKINENPENVYRYGWIFDKSLGYGLFKSEDVVAANHNDKNAFKNWDISVKVLFDSFEKFAKTNDIDFANLTIFDELVLDSKTQIASSQFVYNVFANKFSVLDLLLSYSRGYTKKSRPTNDVEQYFRTKTERKFNEQFSDYTYSFAEVINRDNLQITYSPSNNQFANLPSFLSNASEANTGLEYVVDGTYTDRWNKSLINYSSRDGVSVRQAIIDYETKADDEEKLRAQKLGKRFVESSFKKQSDFSEDANKSSTYFGRFKSINNGWFKDRWYRDVLNFRLYDDEGKPIEDDTIRINDLQGNKVTNRPQAFWQYYIQSQGVGKRNLSNIWRNTDKDAVALFGYLNSQDAAKVEYLVFEDIQTKEKKLLKINKTNASNMFYYKTQNVNNEKDPNARHWLKDEAYKYDDSNGHHEGKGFVAWVSDYAIMSNYANKLLSPGHEYKVYFAADQSGQKTLNIDLGTYESVSENGKTFSQAPTAVYVKDIDGQKQTIMRVGVQFNGAK
ncbi:PDxFFG protein [Mycoplasmopsis mucosicanis]|uniref:PDxFFG protein n=1 Tax=Mycoplasmopsis mucosicanis TaxID=458208 RepID=A0A507SMC7_9BACT|nr:PDxFFG protein [Mycoplasmopsis mucosicanis]TQC51375.1 PDxFFG protein [Mycoplasmopsis mucosicanis]